MTSIERSMIGENRGPIPTSCSRASRPKRRARGAASLRVFFGATAGRRQDLRDARGGAHGARPAASRSWSATSSRTAASRPSASWKASRRLPTLPIKYRGIVRREFDLDAALARRPAILLVDELAHSNLVGGEPRAASSEALAGRRGAARGRHRRLDDGERPASRKPERPRRADHRRAAARNVAGSHLRRGRRGRAHRPAARRPARAPARPARSTCRSEVRERRRAVLPHAEPDRAARARAAADDEPRRGRRARLARGRSDVARMARAASTCSWRSAPMRRPSSSCARASASPTRCGANWTVVYVETPWLHAALRRRNAIAGSICCGSPSRSARRP